MVTVKVPATSANLGPGFDTLGIALNLYLQVKVELASGQEIEFKGEGEEIIRFDLAKNLVVKAMQPVFKQAGKFPGYRLVINNHIPVGKGLGSSAAAIVGGMYAANLLLEEPFTCSQLMQWAVEMEGHADNIVPAMVGGLTAAMMYQGKVYYQKVEIPSDLYMVVAVPDFDLPTSKSRSVLPDQVKLLDTVSNLQRACYLLASIFNRDYQHIDLAMDDMIYQPLRKQFIPGFDAVLEAARDNKALGVAMSGAGPAIIAFTMDNTKELKAAMQEAFVSQGVNCRVYSLKADQHGATVL
ncbi:homoserine kinase [Syntrophomonas erecta subsp. sporosyntropha]